MADVMTAGVVDAPVNAGEASVKTDAASSGGTETDASESSQGGQEQAGGSQDSSELGSANGQGFRQRGPTKLDTIRELRSRLREERAQWQEQVGTLQQRLEEIESRFKSGNRDEKPSRTFWEAPEEVLEERLQNSIAAMEERLAKRWESSQTQNQKTAEWKSETSEAEKFIQSQKVTLEDQEEMKGIIQDNWSTFEKLRPMDRAKYALYLWKEEKGINQDKSGLKAKAASVQGAAPQNGGTKIWTEAEMEKELNKLPQNPKDYTEEDKKRFDLLNREFESAYKQGRVKK